MQHFDFKKWVPYLAAIIIFLIITFAYFTPLLEGKKMFQSDIAHFQGMSKEIVDYREKTGQEPLWTNSMFGGMPAYQISTKYTGNALGYLDKIVTLGLPRPADMVFLYFIGFFVLLLAMGVNPWLSIVGAIGFAFSSYFFIIFEAGHNSKAVAIGYMAPVVAGIILTMKRKYLWGGLLTAVALSLEIKANHPQITYYLAMIAVLLGIFKLIHAIRFKELTPFLKAVGVLIIAASFGVLTNITSLWATWEYGKYTIRGKSELSTEKENRTSGLDKDYATQWSYGIGETMTLMIPDVYGGSSSMKLDKNSKILEAMKANGLPDDAIREFGSQPLPFLYWGAQPFTSGPVYVGAILLFLFVLGLIIVAGPIRWWLLSATVLSIILAWGHNLMPVTDFFFTYLPGYNKFRAVTMILVIAEFCIPLLGILALQELIVKRHDTKKMFRGLQIAAIITTGICLLFALLPGLFLSFSGSNDAFLQRQYQLPDWFMQAIRDDRMRVVRFDAFRSLVFILLGAALCWALLFNKIKKEYAYLLFGVLILADMFTVNKRYVSNDIFVSKSRIEKPFEPTSADLEILKDPSLDYRVLNLTKSVFNDASASYFHKSIGGYHGAKLRRYQELIDHNIENEIRSFASTMSNDSTPVLNMLNTKYIILPQKEGAPVAFPNLKALGNAWFPKTYRFVANADEEINALKSFKPESLAIIDKSFSDFVNGKGLGYDSANTITLTAYEPNMLKYEYSATTPALVVFSEIYYPKGWNAYIDGQPAPHFRSNYVLRSMVLPAGKHLVEFMFEPVVYSAGEKISGISSWLLLALIVVAGVFEFRKKRATKA